MRNDYGAYSPMKSLPAGSAVAATHFQTTEAVIENELDSDITYYYYSVQCAVHYTRELTLPLNRIPIFIILMDPT